MIQLVLRGLFLLMTAAVAALYAVRAFAESASGIILTIALALIISGLIVLIDIYTPRKRLSAISGVFLGLIVGMLAAYALTFLVDYTATIFFDIPDDLIQGVKVLIGVVCVFVSISLILQTKDDFRFVIPYVEFAKQIRGHRPMVLDTSAIIDGRIHDVAQTQIIQGLLIVPRFVLNEIQTVADSSDRLKRARGRRGLDVLAKLQTSPNVEFAIDESDAQGANVDQKLMSLAHDLNGRILTTDFNLTKVAQLRGIDVININSLAQALRPVVLPGELMTVKIIKPGEGPNQGVGYLDDGTMIVVESARDRIGQDVALSVTSVLQTAAGRMIFGRLTAIDDAAAPALAEPPAPASADPSAPTATKGKPRQGSRSQAN
jgi:uncharacterized protein YacL